MLRSAAPPGILPIVYPARAWCFTRGMRTALRPSMRRIAASLLMPRFFACGEDVDAILGDTQENL